MTKTMMNIMDYAKSTKSIEHTLVLDKGEFSDKVRIAKVPANELVINLGEIQRLGRMQEGEFDVASVGGMIDTMAEIAYQVVRRNDDVEKHYFDSVEDIKYIYTFDRIQDLMDLVSPMMAYYDMPQMSGADAAQSEQVLDDNPLSEK